MTTVSPIDIAVLPGDGIGIDVTEAAIPVFSALDLPITLNFGDIGWDCWQREGNPVPEKTWALIDKCDATLLGAITSMPKREAEKTLPKALQNQGITYVSPIVQLRQQLDLYANLRPCLNIKNEARAFHFSVIRENTEGLYAGFDYHPAPAEIQPLLAQSDRWKNKDSNTISASLRLQSEAGLLRLFRFAFSHARAQGFSRVTFADKPNVLRESAAYARSLFESVAREYEGIEADILNVDAVALWMVRRPENFGVIVAENMFGDILSDLAAGVMGGLGFAPSANIGEKGAYFEPVHGSAPNVSRGLANPSAMFLSIAMLLQHLNMNEAAQKIRRGVSQVIKRGRFVTYDLGGKASTKEMSDAIIDATLSPCAFKTIGLLATGAELLNGDVIDNNMQHFSKLLHEKGGVVRGKAITSDNLIDISSQLLYLLDSNDAVIVTGGLGPTSDDNTRFALARATKTSLKLDEASWQHVVKRLEKYGLAVTDANQKQALFPEAAVILHNQSGTANGCYLKWGGRDIFMLPGPPNECFHMFESDVLPILADHHYFHARETTKQFLTMGLIEGDISEVIDALAASYAVETAYCWHYPFLEIKFSTAEKSFDPAFEKALHARLLPHTVSTTGASSRTLLEACHKKLHETIYVVLPAHQHSYCEALAFEKIIFTDEKNLPSDARHVFYVTITAETAIATITVCGEVNGCTTYHDKIKTPKRDEAVVIFYEAYIAWQLVKFIEACFKVTDGEFRETETV